LTRMCGGWHRGGRADRAFVTGQYAEREVIGANTVIYHGLKPSPVSNEAERERERESV